MNHLLQKWFQLSEELKKRFNRERFSPEFQGFALYGVKVIALFEIVQQGFAALVKGCADKPAESVGIVHRVIYFWCHLQDSTIDSRLWSKDLASNLEEVVDIAEGLQLDGENAIILCAGLCDNSHGNFMLHHQCGREDIVAMFKKFEKDRGGDGVGDIAEYPEWFCLCKCGKIGFKEVALNQLELRVLAPYEFCKLPIFFDNGEYRTATNDLSCQGSEPRANFKNVLLGASS